MHWVHFVLLRGVAKRARVNPFTIYCCRSLLQLPLMLQMWLPTCAIHSVWCLFFFSLNQSAVTAYVIFLNDDELNTHQLNSAQQPLPQRKSNAIHWPIELLHGLPFFFKLLLLLLTTLMNSIAFVVFRLHTIFFFFLAFFCRTAPADVWWRVVVRWLSNRQKAQYFDGEKWANTATHSLRHTETRTDSSAEWWIIVTEWTNVKQSTPTSTLWANIIYFQHLIQKLLYWIIIP